MDQNRMQKPEGTSPRVTVLMCVYNGEQYLRESIESILRQTYRDYEFLILDDGSTDGTRDICLSYNDPRIRFAENPRNLGLPKSLNRGLELARGEMVCRMDCDDVCFPDRIQTQVAYMDKHPETHVLGSQVVHFRTSIQSKRPSAMVIPTTDAGFKWCLMFGTIFYHPSVMYRRNIIWGELGGYDPFYAVEEDKELWSRTISKYSTTCCANLGQVLIGMRQHPSSITGDLGHPRRQGHYERVCALARINMKMILDMEEVPSEWYRPWMALMSDASLDVAEIVSFGRVIEAIRSHFMAIHPHAKGNPEIRRHVACMKKCLAQGLVTRSRLRSIRLWREACRIDLPTGMRGSGTFWLKLILGRHRSRLRHLLLRT